METKHTLGPWRAVGTFVEGGGRAIAKAVLLAKSNLAGEGSENELGKANARLIAAAPDLLEACEAIALDLENNGELYETDEARIEILRAAIAKARGE